MCANFKSHYSFMCEFKVDIHWKRFPNTIFTSSPIILIKIWHVGSLTSNRLSMNNFIPRKKKKAMLVWNSLRVNKWLENSFLAILLQLDLYGSPILTQCCQGSCQVNRFSIRSRCMAVEWRDVRQWAAPLPGTISPLCDSIWHYGVH